MFVLAAGFAGILTFVLAFLSLAGLKRDEAADVFSHLGFDVTKEVTKDGDKETETLMPRSQTKKFGAHSGKKRSEKPDTLIYEQGERFMLEMQNEAICPDNVIKINRLDQRPPEEANIKDKK